MNTKPGVKTTELYVTLINAAAGLLITLGYLTPQEADELVKAIVTVIGGMMVVVSSALYIYGRIKLKQTANTVSTTPGKMPMTDTLLKLEEDNTVYPH